VKASAELPSALFGIVWDSGARAAGSHDDVFSLYQKRWHWSRRSLDNGRKETFATAASLHEIGSIFGQHFREGEAERASFFCAPKAEGVDSEGLEDDMDMFPLDDVLQEIAPVFSRTTISPLEYGNGRNWFIWRWSEARPNTARGPTDKREHHLFWFTTTELSGPPRMLFHNVRPPQAGDPSDRWSAWEIALASDDIVLHSVWQNDVGTGAFCAVLDRSLPGATTLEFFESVSPSWKKLPSGEIADSWGNLVVSPSADWDALNLEFEWANRDALENRQGLLSDD
jgi:hypothetical protein